MNLSQSGQPFVEEYGNRFLPLSVFDGTLTDSSRTNIQAFRMLYASVLSGQIAVNNNSLPSLASVNASLANHSAASEAIPIAIACINYASIRPDAVSGGFFSLQNEQLYDNPSRSSSPYESRMLFAASPTRTVSETGNVSFILPDDLFLRQITTPVTYSLVSVPNLQVDFGDGRGYVAVATNTPVSVSYCSSGTKRIKVAASHSISRPRIGTRPGSTQYYRYESHFDFEVQNASCEPNRYASDGTRQTFAPRAGVHSGGEAFIRYGGSGRSHSAYQAADSSRRL